ncbi:MAG: hypothetical protein APF80_00210 [Alphaproteobacteria bacterium BRH_c36]|nr:MAG: hypothetical protein APF80_00210 [Alphaproteobacteria bacterium BRH_c36]
MASILRRLADSVGFPRISIYLPTHPTFPDCEQDPIRLSKALNEVAQQLSEVGWRDNAIASLTHEAAARGKDHPFWRYQDEGLAVFIEEGATQWVKLPASVMELSVVAPRYHIRPLIRPLRDHGVFHVLKVSLDEARFFNGTADGLREIQLDDMPTSAAEVRERTKLSANVGYHARDRGSQVGGADAPKYAALGESPEDYEDVILDQYTQRIAKAVDAHLSSSTSPLVLVALPRMMGRLKSHIDYVGATEDAIAQDPQSLDDTDLHDRALEIASPVLTADRERLRAQLQAAANGGTAKPYSENLEDILRAAEDGRVEAVFLSLDHVVWGIYDTNYRIIRIDHDSGPENEDLLNLAALRTLAGGGEVRTLPDDFRGPVAALYRY